MTRRTGNEDFQPAAGKAVLPPEFIPPTCTGLPETVIPLERPALDPC